MCRDKFDKLYQGSMKVSDYEARFYALSRYGLSRIPTDFERIRRFTKGLERYFQEAIASLVFV